MTQPTTSPNSSLPEGHLTQLLKDVMQLATYAVEKGLLPKQVQLEDLYRMWSHKIEQHTALTDNELNNHQL